jgi:hypothetical protein
VVKKTGSLTTMVLPERTKLYGVETKDHKKVGWRKTS